MASSTREWKYDVFVSFKGEDTRTTFTGHLYAALEQKEISPFRDDEMNRGKRIRPELLKAIEQSRIAVVIFSRDYASSSWCLTKLAKIRVEEMLDSYLREGLGGVHFVGICGMGGIGKTTLARAIYSRISGDFEASSFIANVSEETKNLRLVALQKQLLFEILMESEIRISNVHEGIDVIRNRLHDKRVLIVLDDVDEKH